MGFISRCIILYGEILFAAIELYRQSTASAFCSDFCMRQTGAKSRENRGSAIHSNETS